MFVLPGTNETVYTQAPEDFCLPLVVFMCAPEYKGVPLNVGNIGKVTDELLEHIRSSWQNFQPGTEWKQEDGTFGPVRPEKLDSQIPADQPPEESV